MEFKEYLRTDLEETIDDFKAAGAIVTVAGGTYLALTGLAFAIGIPTVATTNGIERLAGRTEETITARVIRTDRQSLPNGGEFGYAYIKTQDGRILEVHDTPDIPEGKILSNRIIYRMQSGERYELTISHSILGDNIISGQKISR